MPEAKNILVTDSSKAARHLVRSCLEPLGYHIYEASNGNESLHCARENHIDLAILSIELEGLNGYETCSQLTEMARQQDRDLPVILLTSHDSLEAREKGLNAGAIEYLIKSSSQIELVRSVTSILNTEDTLKDANILLVEDSISTISVISQYLQQFQARVHSARNGREALDLIHKTEIHFDLLILDVYMPEMGGFELCQKIKQIAKLKNVPIIFLTASTQTDDIIRVFQYGGSDYISKPYIKEELIARIRSHLHSYFESREKLDTIAELKQTQVLKDNMLSIASHDWKTPLNAIIGFSELLLEEAQFSDESKEEVEYIHAAGLKLLNSINELLLITKEHSLQNLNLKTIELNQLIRDLCTEMQANAKLYKIELQCQIGTEEIYLKTDKDALNKIFNNLLSNALKFTISGGKVTITTKRNKNLIQVEIRDTGIGIPDEKISQIFEKHVSLDKAGTHGESNTGLGLYIVKEYLTALGGSIQVESKPGEGSAFTVHLPANL